MTRATNHSTGPQPNQPGRREILLGAAALALLAGCATTEPAGAPPATSAPDLSGDVATAVEAVGLLLGIRAVLAATTAAHPGLSGRLTGFAQSHRAHLDALSAAVPDRVDPRTPTAPYRAPRSAARAMAVLTTRETELRDQFLALALRAESGPFARLLGTISAGLSQQLAETAR